MSGADYARLRELFDHLVSLPTDARDAFLDAHVPPSDPLRDELMALLAAGEDTQFLAAPALAVLTPGGSDEPPVPLAQVGPYRIVRELGRGGMGTVYQATRNDDVFHKVVAIKVISGSPEHQGLVERFKRERQILARFEHPQIARILDGGTTSDGRPYFVMEYVDGLPLDEYCSRIDADVRTRLALVLQVCDALEHLHGQGIVHRDLKPSNIFVTRDGRVKLLDFGIATSRANEPVDEVGRATMIATPGYASPEQLAGELVGPASDVYCLGVVLYELLSGQLPFADDHGHPDLHAQRTTDQPAPPSRPRGHRAPKTDQVLKAVGSDLDRIVLAALHREPLRRYPSIRSLADDIQRYLAGRPISAKADRWMYVARLSLVRNRLAAGLALLVAIAVAVALWIGVSARMDRIRLEAKEGEIERLVAMLNTRVERWPAEQTPTAQAEKVADVRVAAGVMSSETLEEVSARAPDLTRVKRLIVDLRRFLDRAEQLSQDQPPLRKEIALAYRKVGDFESNEAKPRVLDRRQATASYTRAATVASSIRGAEPEWAQQQLGELSSRLEVLGTRLDPGLLALPEPAVEEAAVAVATKPPSTSVRRPNATPAELVRPAGSVDAARMADLRDRLDSSRAVAARTRTNLKDLEARLAGQGQTLRADLSASMAQVDGLLGQADKLLEIGELAHVEDLLRRVAYELRRLAQSVGG